MSTDNDSLSNIENALDFYGSFNSERIFTHDLETQHKE